MPSDGLVELGRCLDQERAARQALERRLDAVAAAFQVGLTNLHDSLVAEQRAREAVGAGLHDLAVRVELLSTNVQAWMEGEHTARAALTARLQADASATGFPEAWIRAELLALGNTLDALSVRLMPSPSEFAVTGGSSP